MSRVITISGENVSIPNSYANGSNTAFTISNAASMYFDTTHSSYATLKCTSANSVNDIYIIFNSALFNDIPNTATITSISCKLRCKSNSTGNSGTTATHIQAYAGATAKGSANTTNSNALSTRTINVGSASSWTVNDIKNFKLYIKVTNGKNNRGSFYVYGADLTVAYSGTINEYDIVSSDTASNGDLTPIGTKSLYEGDSKTYKITTDYIERLYLKDNGTVVNNAISDVASAPATSNDFYPVLFNSNDSSYNGNDGSYPLSNGCGSAGSSTETRIYTNIGAGAETYFYYKFDFSSISAFAVIDSISCRFKGAMSAGDNSQYYTKQDFQLYCGTTPKGSSTRLTGSTATTYTMNNAGNWTREELDDLQIGFHAIRGTSLTDAAHYVRFYGATVTIEYHVEACKSYAIENISADHTLVLEDRPTYTITSSSSASGASVTPASVTVYEGNSTTLNFTISDISRIIVTDNGNEITSSLTGSGTSYIYTLTNVTAAHIIQIIEAIANKLFLKANGSWGNPISKVYKKISGVWTEVSDFSTLFETNKIYVHNS